MASRDVALTLVGGPTLLIEIAVYALR